MDAFYKSWMARKEQLLHELASTPRAGPGAEQHLRHLIRRVLSHHHAYDKERSRIAQNDVLLVYSPNWLTPFESTFLWLAHWKPSLALRLLRSSTASGEELSAEQVEAVSELEKETAEQERDLGAEVVALQEMVAMPQVLVLVRRRETALGGEAAATVEAMVGKLESMVEKADHLRANVVGKLMEILSPVQAVDFLAAAAQLHLRIREWGLRSGGAAAGGAAVA